MGVADRIESPTSPGFLDEDVEDDKVITAAGDAYSAMLNERYQALVASNPGMNEEGAARYFELLNQIPEGYIYFGTWPDQETSKQYSVPLPPPDTIVFNRQVFGIDGVLLPGYVHLIKELPKQ